MRKFILLNGPKQVGKDTFALQMHKRYPETFQTVKFAETLKRACNSLLGYPDENFEHFEADKETFIPSVRMTYREFLIWMSEEVMKPKFGKSFFGDRLMEMLTRRHQLSSRFIVYVSADSRFKEEALPILQALGAENLLVVRIHRKNHDFMEDSGGYLDLSDHGVTHLDVHNDFDFNFIDDVISIVLKGWLSNDLESALTTFAQAYSNRPAHLSGVVAHINR